MSASPSSSSSSEPFIRVSTFIGREGNSHLAFKQSVETDEVRAKNMRLGVDFYRHNTDDALFHITPRSLTFRKTYNLDQENLFLLFPATIGDYVLMHHKLTEDSNTTPVLVVANRELVEEIRQFNSQREDPTFTSEAISVSTTASVDSITRDAIFEKAKAIISPPAPSPSSAFSAMKDRFKSFFFRDSNSRHEHDDGAAPRPTGM